MIVTISNITQMNDILNTSNNKLVILYFYATWCGPCKGMTAPLRSMSNSYADRLVILKINVDKFQALSDMYAVNLIPTFVFKKNGRKVHKFTGADITLLKTKIDKYI